MPRQRRWLGAHRATDAVDLLDHHKLGDKVPGELPPAPLEPRPPAPTETELRMKLAQAIDTYRRAHAAEAQAEATARRAMDPEHLQNGTRSVRRPDDQVAAETIAALRDTERERIEPIFAGALSLGMTLPAP